jgi:aspartokinase-like uncharacterized kinase
MCGTPVVVVKVGGSLYDLPDLRLRLCNWLDSLDTPRVVLVPGGGPTAEVIRLLDHRHGLGEEKSHWLALRALSLNAYFLADLLPGAAVIDTGENCARLWARHQVPVLDAARFAERDEHEPGRLAHSWDVTSDSLAARVAIVLQAQQLVLLKSVTFPEWTDWSEASHQGLVDRAFRSVLAEAPTLSVRSVNLRVWPTGMVSLT